MQRARVSRSQLRVLGFSPSAIGRRLEGASLYLIHRAVYGVGPRVEVEFGDETAALLAVGDPAALGVDSAAHLWGFWPAHPDIVHIVIPDHRTKSRTGICVHRSLSLTHADTTFRSRLPVTTPARTLLDLAEAHPPRAVERALDEAFARRLVSPTKLREQLARSPGRAGAPLLTSLLDPHRARGVTKEQGEERLLALFRHAQLPDPERNVRLGPFTVDFLWRDQQVAVEFDSFTWHTSPTAFRRDRAKDAYLKDAGIDLHRVTWTMLDDPVPLIARVVRAQQTVR
jgi:very-short-patch-repair endonuclease